MNNNQVPFNRWSIASIFFLSMVLIALQLTLMRALSVTRYYHFSYLVISTALLGFGASGTFLTFAYRKLKRHPAEWITGIFLLLICSIPICYRMAQQLPIDIRYLFYSGDQILLLMLYNLLIFVPFFLGAVIIGFMLTFFKKQVPELYGSNLIGSGAGGLSALLLMFWVPSAELPLTVTVLGLFAMVCWILAAKTAFGSGWIPISIVSAAVVVIIWGLAAEMKPNYDPYKTISHLIDLQQQGDATHAKTIYGPRGQIDIFEAPSIHRTMFAGVQADTVPPAQMSILTDGHESGTMFKIDRRAGARIMDFTPQSIPYRMIDRPRVLLLGEVGGSNIWLARRFGAEQITVVQTNPRLINLMRRDLAEENGRVFRGEDIEVHTTHPRLFIEQTEQRYDIIHLVSAESISAGGQGLQGLHEDFLLTVEGIRAALHRLSPDGILSVTRGMQSPPRDNIKLFTLFKHAIETDGQADRAGDHLLQSRNYLAVNTMLAKSPLSQKRVDHFRSAAAALGMDQEYYPGIRSDTLQQQNIMEGPEGASYSYFHYAAMQLLSGDADRFLDSWVYNIRPPTDDRPYFYNFFKWGSLDRFVETYGRNWFQRLELGYVILVVTFAELALIAFLLIILPLFFLRKSFREAKNKLPVVLHFGAIGIGFMFLEMVYIQKFTQFMGDPVYSVSAALTAILVFSGLGSSVQHRISAGPVRRIVAATSAITVISLLYLWLLDPFLELFIDLHTAVRFVIVLLMVSPIAFFMGWMFPSGIDLVEKHADRMTPWAWGINGFASVAAAPLAVILSMEIGFSGVIGLALGCYLIAALTGMLWN